MTTLIETVEKAIEHEKWSIAYHTSAFEKALATRNGLQQELAQLKYKFGIKDENHVNIEAFDGIKDQEIPLENIDA